MSQDFKFNRLKSWLLFVRVDGKSRLFDLEYLKMLKEYADGKERLIDSHLAEEFSDTPKAKELQDRAVVELALQLQEHTVAGRITLSSVTELLCLSVDTVRHWDRALLNYEHVAYQRFRSKRHTIASFRMINLIDAIEWNLPSQFCVTVP